MSLVVRIRDKEAWALRGQVHVGTFYLDDHLQLQRVVVLRAATPGETEQILRLAASHVAQFNVTGRTLTTSVATVLQSTRRLPPIPGLRGEDSIRLLNFNALPPQHAGISVSQLVEVMRSVGVVVVRQ